jgi:ATP adenylyltransferase/5',5'''-P-1,P-4-tetraphosphate phosphorylase II
MHVCSVDFYLKIKKKKKFLDTFNSTPLKNISFSVSANTTLFLSLRAESQLSMPITFVDIMMRILSFLGNGLDYTQFIGIIRSSRLKVRLRQ